MTFVLLALSVAGMEMIEPLFMRYIVDHVLLDTSLTTAQRVLRLNLAGLVFLAVIVLSNITTVFKDARQKLLNIRIMLHFASRTVPRGCSGLPHAPNFGK